MNSTFPKSAAWCGERRPTSPCSSATSAVASAVSMSSRGRFRRSLIWSIRYSSILPMAFSDVSLIIPTPSSMWKTESTT